MEFCEKCGKPLKEGIISENIKKPEERGEGIVKEEKTKKGFPHKCKKCGYEYSEVTDLGAPYSDEANVYLFKCKKCGCVEREAYGTSNK